MFRFPSRRTKKAPSSHLLGRNYNRKSRLNFESLEERTVLAGNVTASVNGGFLVMIGDAGDNQVAITQSASGGIQVSSLDGTTHINGQAGPISLGRVTTGSVIAMGNGNDVVRLQGTAESALAFGGYSTIDLGNGNDTVQFSNFRATSLAVLGGSGDDQLVGQRDLANIGASAGIGLNVSTFELINMGLGNDRVDLRNSTFANVFILDAGLGNDAVDIRASQGGRTSILIGGLGNDSLNAAGNVSFSPIVVLFETRTAINGPVAVNDSVTVAEGDAVNISVLGNDVATSGAINASSVVIVQAPLRGTAVVNADGTITYTHNGSEIATDVFTYRVTDVNGNVSNVGTVNIAITPINDLPTISAVADASTQEDVAVAPISLTVGDAETAAAALLVTATSSDTSVIANNGIAITGTGANRTVVVTPVANASGSATINLTVADANGGTATSSFVVTVNPVNDLPTITAVQNVLAAVGVSLSPINVTIGDVETPATSLIVTATSSNQALITDAGIQVSGTGAARTVAITPVANATGTATITLTVDDTTGGTTTQTFTVTISNPPTITDIADQVTLEDTATASAAFTIGDVETLPDNLIITTSSSNASVVAQNGIQISGTGANRSIVITPVANASGSSTITVTVKDAAGLSVSDTFVVTVTAVNDAPVVADEQLSANAHSTTTVTRTGNLLANDTDVDGPSALVISSITIGGTQTSIAAGGQASVDTSFGHIVVNSNGTFTYTYTYVPGTPSAQAIDILAANGLLPVADEIDYSVSDSLLTTDGILDVNLS
jgi:hypothetical protein